MCVVVHPTVVVAVVVMPPKKAASKAPAASQRAAKLKKSTVTEAASKHLKSASRGLGEDRSRATTPRSRRPPSPSAPTRGHKAQVTERELVNGNSAAAAGSTRVVRRRRETLTPQEAPDWQRALLAKAGATGARGNGKRPTKGGKTKRKTSPRGSEAAKKVVKNRSKAESDSTWTASGESELLSSGGSSGSEDSSEEESGFDSEGSEEASEKRQRKRRRSSAGAVTSPNTRRPQRRRSTSSTGSTPAGSPTSSNVGRRRPRKAEMLCPRCKLLMNEWLYCGLTGEPHQPPEEVRS